MQDNCNRNLEASKKTTKDDQPSLDELSVLLRLIIDIEEIAGSDEDDRDQTIREKCLECFKILRPKTAPALNEQTKAAVYYLQHAAEGMTWNDDNYFARSYLDDCHEQLTGRKLFAGEKGATNG